MAQMMAVMAIASTAMQMIGAHNAGQQKKAEANFEANQMEANANNAEAAAQRKMIEQNKETAYVQSNLQAAAAGGGGSATDPTVVTDIKTIAGEGRYRALTDLYEGDTEAQSLRTQAAATRVGGVNAARAGNLNAFAKGLSGASSLYNNYGSSLYTKYGSVNSNFSDAPPQLPWQRSDYVYNG